MPTKKLIRDKLNILDGVVEVVEHDDYVKLLEEKLDEEILELKNSHFLSVEEYGDVIEVLYTLFREKIGGTILELESVRNFKKDTKGGFDKRIALTVPDKGFYVVGGVYVNTSFEELIPGTEERHGPFNTHEEAFKIWASRAWAKVDDCHAKFKIIQE